jgi:hypothetical protein
VFAYRPSGSRPLVSADAGRDAEEAFPTQPRPPCPFTAVLLQKITMRKRFSLAFAGLAAVLVHAIPNAVPEPTLASENVYNAFGWTPAPTEAPSLELLKRGVGLVRRDLTSGELIGYFAPDTMCGYISGSIGMFQHLYMNAQVTLDAESCHFIRSISPMLDSVKVRRHCSPWRLSRSCWLLCKCWG